jgi:hypothetical protein
MPEFWWITCFSTSNQPPRGQFSDPVLRAERDMNGQGASHFGYRVRQDGGAWQWTAFDACGRVCAQGRAPSRAVAAALVIRALAQDALGLDRRLDTAA